MNAEENKSFEPLFHIAKLKDLGGIKAGCLIAVDPLLETKFMNYMARSIKHDRVTVNLVLKTGLSTYTPEPLNTFLRGPPSIGKTFVTVNTLAPFPKEDVWLLGGLSPTALVHDKGVLVDKNNEPIEPVEKPDKDATPEETKEWDRYKERLKESHYIVDLQGKTLVFLEAPSIETFNKLRPILSHDTWETSYKFTDTSAKGMPTRHVIIRGWPATIWLSTMEKYVQDFASRSFTHTPETTEQKYGDANVLTGSKAAFPWKFEKDADAVELEAYVRWFKEQTKGLKAIIPYAEAFGGVFPHKFPRSMRDFKHVLGLIQVSALFHLAQRPLLIRKAADASEEKYVVATEADYDIATALWQTVKESTETSAASHHLVLFHQIIEPLAAEQSRFTVNELTDAWNRKFEDHKSSDTVRNWVDFLCEVGWLDKEQNPADKRSNLLKVIEEKINREHTQNDLSVFFTLQSFKDWLNEARTITEENQVLIRESLVSDGEVSAEEVYRKYFVDKTGENANIVLGLSEGAVAESGEKNTENGKSVQSLNSTESKLLSSKEMLEFLYSELPRGTVFLEQQFLDCVARHGWGRSGHDVLFRQLRTEGSIMSTPEGAWTWA
jgi:hypothetical protein